MIHIKSRLSRIYISIHTPSNGEMLTISDLTGRKLIEKNNRWISTDTGCKNATPDLYLITVDETTKRYTSDETGSSTD